MIEPAKTRGRREQRVAKKICVSGKKEFAALSTGVRPELCCTLPDLPARVLEIVPMPGPGCWKNQFFGDRLLQKSPEEAEVC
jgi:hypothetical protein